MEIPYCLTKEYYYKNRICKLLRWIICSMIVVLLLTGCGKQEENNSTETQEVESSENSETSKDDLKYDNTTLEGIIEGINADFEATTQYLLIEFDKVKTGIGDSYEGYLANKALLTNYYELIYTESEALFKRTEDKSKEYYKLIVATIDPKSDGTREDAMDRHYDEVYDGAFEDYYDDILDDLFDDIYDEYYDGIVEDAYDYIEYKEWSDISDECYELWDDASSDVYDLWSDECSKTYKNWSSISSAFWNNNFDVDAVLEAAAQESTTESESSEEEESEITEDEISPEFKEAMDSYEEFFDEYIAFVKKYKESDNPSSLLSDYADYMTKYSEMTKKMNEINQDELSDAERIYYMDVAVRINKKLVELAE